MSYNWLIFITGKSKTKTTIGTATSETIGVSRWRFSSPKWCLDRESECSKWTDATETKKICRHFQSRHCVQLVRHFLQVCSWFWFVLQFLCVGFRHTCELLWLYILRRMDDFVLPGTGHVFTLYKKSNSFPLTCRLFPSFSWFKSAFGDEHFQGSEASPVSLAGGADWRKCNRLLSLWHGFSVGWASSASASVVSELHN